MAGLELAISFGTCRERSRPGPPMTGLTAEILALSAKVWFG
jgi:hypothetical protein